MGSKDLVTRTQFTSTMKNELYEELKQKSQESGVPISKLLDHAVSMYLLMDSTTRTG